MSRLLIICCCLVLTGEAVYADALSRKNQLANRAYGEEDYGKALSAYLDAQVEAPESPELQYNIGCAYYKQRKFEQAVGAFDKVASSTDLELLKKAYFNRGDALYMLGDQLIKTGKQEGVEKYQEALESYKKVLEYNPGHADAKVNIQFVQRRLKELSKPQEGDQQQKQDQNQKKTPPSAQAKKVKKQAEELVKNGRYRQALNLMEELMKNDPTAAAFKEFVDRVGDLAGITGM